MNILLFGRSGQVAWELQRSLSLLGSVTVVDRHHEALCGDLTQPEGIANTIRSLKPDVVVNAAAYTAVDTAEQDRESALLVNSESVEVMARETAQLGALLVHYSTDYVFDGSGDHYRKEHEATGPLNVYGQTKLAGEHAIARHNPRHFIFRTSWVYASRGKNFLRTMLKLADEKSSLSIINDQIGAPTSASLIADCTAIAIRDEIQHKSKYGTYHLVASGECSWLEYAEYTFSVARKYHAASKINTVTSISTTEYSTPARRPLNSRLSNRKFQKAFIVTLPDWRCDVARVVSELVS